MAAVSPISDVLSTPYTSPLVLSPSGNQSSLELPATAASQSVDTTQAASAIASSAAASTTAASGAAVATAATTQPLVVLEALANAGLDTAINQEILAPSAGLPAGTFSTFIGELFTAITAQTQAAEQTSKTEAAQNAAAQSAAAQSAQTTQQTQAAAAVANAFAATALAAAPNSALEAQVQSLAQTVNAQAANSDSVTAASASPATTLAPLQESFDQLVAGANGTSSTANLGGFLDSLAQNLHAAPTPLGNIVDSLI
jgi:hypothetical protein